MKYACGQYSVIHTGIGEKCAKLTCTQWSTLELGYSWYVDVLSNCWQSGTRSMLIDSIVFNLHRCWGYVLDKKHADWLLSSIYTGSTSFWDEKRGSGQDPQWGWGSGTRNMVCVPVHSHSPVPFQCKQGWSDKIKQELHPPSFTPQ